MYVRQFALSDTLLYFRHNITNRSHQKNTNARRCSSDSYIINSSFFQLLMPDGLRDYYTDSFELTGQSGCEQKLAQFGLINLDEYDRLSPQKLPLLRALMQMKK